MKLGIFHWGIFLDLCISLNEQRWGVDIREIILKKCVGEFYLDPGAFKFGGYIQIGEIWFINNIYAAQHGF